jgi:voltage-dependent calcium channel N type alpha-1B
MLHGLLFLGISVVTKKNLVTISIASCSSRGRIYYTEMYDMLKNMDPPLGFGSKCPDRLAFKKLIRMNQPIDDEGMVHFTTTLFALIRENLSIKMRAAEEMDQADLELRATIIKVWPYEGKEKIDLLVPPREGEQGIVVNT